MRKEKYKPLLFTLTLRSPYRIEKFLKEVSESEIDGKELDRKNILKLYKNLHFEELHLDLLWLKYCI